MKSKQIILQRRKQWLVAIGTLTILIGGWQWQMAQGATVYAGRIELDAAQEYPDPRENELVRAVGRGDAGLVEGLVRAGVNVNAVSAYRRVTPLIWAVLANQPATVSQLLTLGANPNYRVPTLPGLPPVPQRNTTQNDLVEESPMSEAMRRNNFNILKRLLEGGGDPNIRGQGHPAVWEITQTPQREMNPMIPLLFKHGMDPNLKNHPERVSQDTWLEYLISTGQFETAIYLIEQGADVNLLNWSIAVPIARRSDKIPVTDQDRLFVNYGAQQLQRTTGLDGSKGDAVARKLRQMFVERGVKMPFWDPDSIEHLQQKRPSLAELRKFNTPDEVIEKIIRITKAAEKADFGESYDAYLAKGYCYGEKLEREYLAEKKDKKPQ